MNSNRLLFRSFDTGGEGRVTAFPSLDGLRLQEHLNPVIDSIGKALAGRPAASRLVLSIEETDSFGVEWTTIGDWIGVARLVRADTEAVLVIVIDANGSVDFAAMRSLHIQLSDSLPGAALDAAFEWLLGDGPPLAALAYLRGKPQVGLDTLAMCLAVVFADSPAGVGPRRV